MSVDIPISYFSLRYTFECANPLTFFGHYNFSEDILAYPFSGSIMKVKFFGSSKKGKLSIMEGPQNARKEVISRFRLKDDLKRIYQSINTDDFMAGAIKKYYGMRVTLNDPWETTLCFIISQFNNVKRIRKITLSIIDRFGSDIESTHAAIKKGFPTSEELQDATVKELMECGAGFRAKYIKEAAEYCTNNLDLYRLGRLGYPELKEELMGIKGVGDKVADCIALMGYGKLEAFPIDVWVKRTLERIYFKSKDTKIKDLHRFAEQRWQYPGYAQQYLFWAGRHL